MKYIFSLIIIALSLHTFAQKENTHIRAGNDEFTDNKYDKAEIEYRKALEIDAASYKATFNLADALYKQEKYDEAIKNYNILVNQEKDKHRLAAVHHNIGNSLLQLKKVDEAIEEYKKALRYNPTDVETKYNLAYAKNLKQQQQKQQNQDQKDQKDQKQEDKKDQQNEKEQDKKDKDKNSDQQQKQSNDQNKDNKEQKDQKDQQQQPKDQKDKISKEDAERILKAIQNDEKKVQEKVQEKQKEQAKKVRVEKDW